MELALSHLHLTQPPSFSRRGFAPESFRPVRSRRNKSEGARDAGVRRTRGLRHLATPERSGDPAKDRRPSVETNRKSAEPFGVPRAVFEVCSAAPPVV